jgi:hypothetical protein
MSDYHDLYRLDAKPIDDGGQAHVFRAQNQKAENLLRLNEGRARSMKLKTVSDEKLRYSPPLTTPM